MADPLHLEMHIDHKHQLNELALWQESLGLWHAELAMALRDIDRLKGALESHDKALREHAAELDQAVEQINRHEHALAQHERGETEPALIAMVQEHRDNMARRQAMQKIHERIKKHHHSLIAQWRLLFDALTKPM